MTQADATLQRPHVFRPATAPGRAPLLLLHGTGDDEHGLLPLGEALSPGAALLAPRGTVLEGTAHRFFRRLREGVFDEDDLRARVAELADFLGEAEHEHGVEHGVEPGSWTAVGFSNGANMASAMLLSRPDTLAGAVLFAAVVPFAEPPAADLAGRAVAVVNGRHDPMADPGRTAPLVAQLRERGATVAEFPHDGGHTIPAEVLPDVRAFLSGALPAGGAGR